MKEQTSNWEQYVATLFRDVDAMFASGASAASIHRYMESQLSSSALEEINGGIDEEEYGTLFTYLPPLTNPSEE